MAHGGWAPTELVSLSGKGPSVVRFKFGRYRARFLVLPLKLRFVERRWDAEIFLLILVFFLVRNDFDAVGIEMVEFFFPLGAQPLLAHISQRRIFKNLNGC